MLRYGFFFLFLTLFWSSAGAEESAEAPTVVYSFAPMVRPDNSGNMPYYEDSRFSARNETAGDPAFSSVTQHPKLEDDLKLSPESSLPPGAKKGLIQNISFSGSWSPDIGSKGFALTEAKTSLTMAFPGPKRMGKSFFLLTPNFGYTSAHWDGPQKFPSSLYAAGLNVGWMKPINEQWTFMANVMPHWASDGKSTQDAVRCPLMAGMTWTPNRQWKVMFGAVYLDRSDIAVLPFGGLVWTPNDDWRFELTAPQARISRRLHISTSECKRWGYVGGGFSGGTWAVESVNHRSDLAMFREYSVMLGYECARTNSYTWNAETGYLFGRQMDFEHNTQSRFRPDDSLMLRVKFSY